jgi:hypothetical protein
MQIKLTLTPEEASNLYLSIYASTQKAEKLLVSPDLSESDKDLCRASLNLFESPLEQLQNALIDLQGGKLPEEIKQIPKPWQK